MPIGEPWPWGRWHGHEPPVTYAPWWGVIPPPNPYVPQLPVVTSANTTPVVVNVHAEHKCRVRTSPFDRSVWLVHCQRCSYSRTTRDRSSALDDALGHRYFAWDGMVNGATA